MIDPLSLSAEDILKSRALDIFPNENEMAAIFKKLAKRWHPDTSSGDTRVFSDINSKYQAAQKAWANGGYVSSLKIGSTIFPFMYESRFEMGELYVCPRHIIWAVKRDWDDLAKQWLEVIKKYKFPNDDVKSKIVPHIPKNSHVKAYKDRAYVIIDRPYDLIRCADILRSEGPFDAKHMAWTISRAYNLCGFLNYANIRHNDISVETFFIEPASHRGALLGGWFYAGAPKALAVPSRTSHLISLDAAAAHDAQIKLMGRQLLGIPNAAKVHSSNIPAALKQWLLSAPLKSIHEAETNWKKILKDSFGDPKFIEWKLETSKIYPN